MQFATLKAAMKAPMQGETSVFSEEEVYLHDATVKGKHIREITILALSKTVTMPEAVRDVHLPCESWSKRRRKRYEVAT